MAIDLEYLARLDDLRDAGEDSKRRKAEGERRARLEDQHLALIAQQANERRIYGGKTFAELMAERDDPPRTHDPMADWGSAQNPVLIFGGREIQPPAPPPAQRRSISYERAIDAEAYRAATATPAHAEIMARAASYRPREARRAAPAAPARRPAAVRHDHPPLPPPDPAAVVSWRARRSYERTLAAGGW